MKAPAPGYVLILLLAVCFTLAIWLQPVAASQNTALDQSQNLLHVVMGDGERLFAGLFYRKADIYFHSGYYPSIFSSARTNEMHIAEQAGNEDGKVHNEPEEAESFLKPPLDWIEALGRYSINTVHTHLDASNKTGEMLPWLRMSADLDPQLVNTYVVGSFWLCQMGKVDDALTFLRDGLRANPQSFELQFELGRLYADNKNDPQRALVLLGLALANWQKQEAPKPDPDLHILDNIASRLALLEEKEGDYTNALVHMQLWKSVAPSANDVQKQIDELKARMDKSASVAH